MRMTEEERKLELDLIRKARAATPDSDPWEARTVSFLLSEIDWRDDVLKFYGYEGGTRSLSDLMVKKRSEP